MTAPRQSVATRSGREYVDPTTGARYPSVTRVLGIIDKPLKNWAAKVTAEYAVKHRDVWVQLDADAAIDLIKRESLRYTGRRADIGTAVHAAVEAYADGHLFDPSAYDQDVAPYLTQFKRFLAEWSPTYRYLEATVYSDSVGYAGTLDAIVELPPHGDPGGGDVPYFPGGLVVVDLKTGKDVYDEAALQLAAYANADRIVTGDPENGVPWLSEPMPPIAAGYVLHLGPRSYRFRPVECGPDVHDAFTCAAALAHFRDTRYGTLIHHPLVAPTSTDVDRFADGTGLPAPEAVNRDGASVADDPAAGVSSPTDVGSDGPAVRLPAGWPAVRSQPQAQQVHADPGADVSTADVSSVPVAVAHTAAGTSPQPLETPSTDEARSALRARIDAFPADYRDKAKAGWRRLHLPTLNRATNWTPDLLAEAARLVADAEAAIAYERGGVLQQCAIRTRELGIDDDARHVLVDWLTEGRRKGLKECDLDDLRIVRAHLDTLRAERTETNA